jgi:hypothetical protein
MDQTPNFDCVGLKMLVVDEADRILDMGFQKTVNAIIENLPKERYTLLLMLRSPLCHFHARFRLITCFSVALCSSERCSGKPCYSAPRRRNLFKTWRGCPWIAQSIYPALIVPRSLSLPKTC